MRALGALIVTVVLWGSAFAAIRAALRDMTPEALALIRVLVAALTLAVISAVLRPTRPARRDVPRLIGVALFGVAAYQLLLNKGEVDVPAGPASVLVNLSPIFTALFAVSLLGERMGLLGWVGIVISFSGAGVIGVEAGGPFALRAGVLLVVAAAVSQATFFVLQKCLLGRYSAFGITCWATWLGAVLLLPICISPTYDTRPSGQALAAAVYLGVGPSAIGFVTWAYATARVDVSFAATMLYLAPVFAFAPAWLLLGEEPAATAVLGGLLATAGVAIVAVSRRRLALERAPRRSDPPERT